MAVAYVISFLIVFLAQGIETYYLITKHLQKRIVLKPSDKIFKRVEYQKSGLRVEWNMRKSELRARGVDDVERKEWNCEHIAKN